MLHRAQEHVEVGQKQVALILLYDTLNFINQKRAYPKVCGLLRFLQAKKIICMNSRSFCGKMKNRSLRVQDKEETMRLFHTWSQTHEDIMRLFVELCVDLRDSGMARDGLHAYRTIADKVPRSLETVIQYLFDLADKRVAAALATSRSTAVLEDLEEGSTPEALLKATVTSERERGRSESANVVAAWLTFRWDYTSSSLLALN